MSATETNADPEATAHLDGFWPSPSEADGRTRVVIRLVSGGVPRPDLMPDLVLLDVEATASTDPLAEQVLILAKGLCEFLRTGGQMDLLRAVTDRLAALPRVVPPYALVSVLPPPGGNVVIWRRPDGTYLKVQEGPEGFPEPLSELERAELLRAEAEPDPDYP